MTVPAADTYEAYAIRYAHHARRASANFIGHDPEVLRRYPAPTKKLAGVIARLD